jgi:5-oxoprolinase (ATP-hydrolysing)
MLIEFLIAQRRVHRPYGIDGGGSGASGLNLWIKQRRSEDKDFLSDEESSAQQKPRTINIGGKATVFVGKGDRLIIHTPGGGGWGLPDAIYGEEGTQEGQGKMEWTPRGSLAEREKIQAGF